MKFFEDYRPFEEPKTRAEIELEFLYEKMDELFGPFPPEKETHIEMIRVKSPKQQENVKMRLFDPKKTDDKFPSQKFVRESMKRRGGVMFQTPCLALDQINESINEPEEDKKALHHVIGPLDLKYEEDDMDRYEIKLNFT